jgi:hypothetical protein
MAKDNSTGKDKEFYERDYWLEHFAALVEAAALMLLVFLIWWK